MHHRNRLAAIHANGLAELNLAAPGALLSGVPVVVWAHASSSSGWSRRLAPLWRRLLPRVRWAAGSGVSRDVMVDLDLCRTGEVSIIPNPVDPEDVRADRREPRDLPTIGYIAPATRQKGFDLLPEIAARLGEASVRWELFVPATTVESVLRMDQFERVKTAAGGNAAVHPWVEDVRQVYAACDVLLCPSLAEASPRIVAEAMTNGIPVVASDLPGIREMLGDDEAGLLFPVEDAHAAADALGRLLSDAELRARLGEEGKVRSHVFRPDQVVRQLGALYGDPDGDAVAGDGPSRQRAHSGLRERS